jgi:hypothetical protein
LRGKWCEEMKEDGVLELRVKLGEKMRRGAYPRK